jgi:hypothetical protein
VLRCSITAPCNMASWYGDSTVIPNGSNCWLKQLSASCQYPADLERHEDDRYLLLVRPVETCALLFSRLPPCKDVLLSRFFSWACMVACIRMRPAAVALSRAWADCLSPYMIKGGTAAFSIVQDVNA